MLEALRRDYDAMTGMILGAAPAFDEVVAAVGALEIRLNDGDDVTILNPENGASSYP
jgi:hypothetical protein